MNLIYVQKGMKVHSFNSSHEIPGICLGLYWGRLSDLDIFLDEAVFSDNRRQPICYGKIPILILWNH
jgi:hypothetical protein